MNRLLSIPSINMGQQLYITSNEELLIEETRPDLLPILISRGRHPWLRYRPKPVQLVKKATVHLPSFHRLSEAQDSIQLSYAFLTDRDSSITAQLSSEAVLPSHSITESLQLGIYQISKIESIRRITRNWEFKRGLNVDAGWELLFYLAYLYLYLYP